MNKYIFLTGQYMPKPGATGVCVHNLAKTLAEQNCHVFTVCFGSNTSKEQNIDGVRVINIKAPHYIRYSDSRLRFAKSYSKLCSLFSKLIHINKYPLRSNKLVKNYINVVKRNIQKNEEFTVIASFTPIEAVIAGAVIKKKFPNCRAVYYSTDTLSNEQGESGLLSAQRRSKLGYKWEKKLFEIYDKILIMECHKEFYFGKQFSNFFSKFSVVNFPMLNIKKDRLFKSNDKIIYLGTLYKKLRNPTVVCKTLLKVLDAVNKEILFIGGGDCNEELDYYQKLSHGKITYLNMQPYNVAQDYLQNAGILLSIGNTESPMAPSKIFEYISTGKPIIHFYSWDKDPCLSVLTKYGNALLVNEDSPNVSDLIEFINKSEDIEVTKLKSLFETSIPDYTVDLILNTNN